MSTASRLQYKAKLDSWGAFDTSIQLSEQALAANKIKKYQNLKELIHENYFKFDRDYRNYKADTIEKTAKTEEVFNGTSVDDQSRETICNCKHDNSADASLF